MIHTLHEFQPNFEELLFADRTLVFYLGQSTTQDGPPSVSICFSPDANARKTSAPKNETPVVM